MISSITKSKIPNDFSYVLKTSQLEEILGIENIITNVTLEYWKPQIIGSIFEVHYWLPNENNPFNRLYIRARAILKRDVYIAREGLQKEILPEFVKWIKNIEQLEKSSPLNTERLFAGYYRNNKVSIVKLFIISEDKKFIVRYSVGQSKQGKQPIIEIQGKEFEGLNAVGKGFQRAITPQWDDGIITPGLVREIIEWWFSPKSEVTFVDWQGNIINS